MSYRESTKASPSTGIDAAPEVMNDDALDDIQGGLRYELKNVHVTSYSIQGSASAAIINPDSMRPLGSKR